MKADKTLIEFKMTEHATIVDDLGQSRRERALLVEKYKTCLVERDDHRQQIIQMQTQFEVALNQQSEEVGIV
jgi:hypothetical protein